MRCFATLLLLVTSTSHALDAQSVAQRVSASDGLVQVVFPSRAGACGDGTSFIGNVLGQSTLQSGSGTVSGHTVMTDRPCIHGPGRALATVIGGEVTRVRTYVGPIPSPRSDVRTLNVSAADAETWLADLVAHGSSRVANDAMLPLLVADAPEPWPLLLRVARDDNRPRDVRLGATTWLGNGVIERLGLSSDRAETDAEEMRSQAVFLISQRPASESVPELVRLARLEKNGSVRRAAIFWLGQTGDRQAADVYAELLGVR